MRYAYEITKQLTDWKETIIGTRMEMSADTIQIWDDERVVFAYRGYGLKARETGTEEQHKETLSRQLDAYLAWAKLSAESSRYLVQQIQEQSKQHDEKPKSVAKRLTETIFPAKKP